MRYIVDYRLDDNTVLSAVIANARSEKEAVIQGIKASEYCFKNPKYRKFKLSKSTKFKVEKWKDTGKIIHKKGNFKCSVLAVYNQNEIKSQDISTGQGVKTTYNLILSTYPKNPLVVFIYDLTQSPKKRRASLLANKILKDEKKTKELLMKFEKELENVPIGGEYLADIPALCSMIIDYQKGHYREVPVKVIIGAIGTILYFVSPVDLIPDIIPFFGQLDDITVIIWLLKQCHKEIEGYKHWRKKQQKQVK